MAENRSAPVCAVHGRPIRQLGGASVCPACLAQGTRAARERWAAVQERMSQATAAARLGAANVPELFRGRGFESFEAVGERASRVVEGFSGFAAGFAANRFTRTGFILIGPPATGKTHLACAVIQALLGQGYAALYASLPALTREVRAAYGKSQSAGAILRRLVEVDFLVLDEIDLHGASDNDYNMLYDIINGRYAKPGFPTMAISNRSIEMLTKDLDERLVTRLLAGTSPVLCDWVPRRDVRRAGAQPGARS